MVFIDVNEIDATTGLIASLNSGGEDFKRKDVHDTLCSILTGLVLNHANESELSKSIRIINTEFNPLVNSSRKPNEIHILGVKISKNSSNMRKIGEMNMCYTQDRLLIGVNLDNYETRNFSVPYDAIQLDDKK
ncbi:MAG: hypothetical protein HRU03_01895 [Nanoarchaeales archaeon]|nr:hypothetical protein [Nanoarchaeales archaeon]